MRTQLTLRVGFLLAVALPLATNPQARAGFLTNGDFSNGLTGYTATPAGDVTAANNQATIFEDANVSEVDLSQTFTIPVGAKTFSFDLISYTLDTTFTNPIPDGFGASLLDPVTGNSLVPTALGSTDSYFTQDLLANTPPVIASGVTLSPANGTPPLTITLDVSALGGQNAEILFRLIGGGDNTTDTLTLTNLVVGPQAGGAVPEPPSILLASIGVLGCTFCYLMRGRHFPTLIAPLRACPE